MAKQAVKKGAGVKKSGLDAFKERKGMVYKPGEKEKFSNAEKPLSWIPMPRCFQEVTKLNGIPEGMVVMAMGHSNTGKSVMINHAMINSIKYNNLIPVFFDTENAFSFQFATQMGLDATPVYDDVEVEDVSKETGEVTYHTEKQIVNWDGEFLYYSSKILADQYGYWDHSQGKQTNKKRTEAVIEDIAMCINELLDAQENGEINKGFLFIWDSVGSIDCYKSYAAKVSNNMWNANAISVCMNRIVNSRIPGSKAVNGPSPYTNTMLIINKIWLDSMSNPVGIPIMRTKGGSSLGYSVRLCFQLGSQLTSGVKRLTATYKSATYSFAIETKIKVTKNHLDAPHNVCYEGSLIACDLGFIGVDELDEYKKTHISKIIKELEKLSGESGITEKDITFQEVEEEE